MEAKRGGLKWSDLKNDALEQEAIDWLAACMVPEREESLSYHVTVKKVTIVPAKTLAFIQMDRKTLEEKTIGQEERQLIVNRTYSVQPGREWIIPCSLITEREVVLSIPILNLA
jgi:hypothetical protein